MPSATVAERGWLPRTLPCLDCDLPLPLRTFSEEREWGREMEGAGGMLTNVVLAGVGVGSPSSDMRAEVGVCDAVGVGDTAGSDFTRLRASSKLSSVASWRDGGCAGEGWRGKLLLLTLGEGGMTVTLGPDLSLAESSSSVCRGGGGRSAPFPCPFPFACLSRLFFWELVELMLMDGWRLDGDWGDEVALELREWLLDGLTNLDRKLGAISPCAVCFSLNLSTERCLPATIPSLLVTEGSVMCALAASCGTGCVRCVADVTTGDRSCGESEQVREVKARVPCTEKQPRGPGVAVERDSFCGWSRAWYQDMIIGRSPPPWPRPQ